MRKLAALATLVATTAWSGSVLARDVTLATEASFPPFSQTEADGSYTGFEIDLGNAVCAHLEWNCTWVQQDFDGAIAALLAKRFDIIFSSMSIKPEREKVADFSIPYYATPTSFFGAADRDLSPPDGLNGLTLGVYGGSTQHSYAEANFDGAAIRQYENIDQMGADLANGRIDLMFVEQLPGLTWTASKDGAGFAMLGDSIPLEQFGEQGAGAMFRKGDDDLRTQVNRALRALYEDGTFDAIQARWLPEGTDIGADGFWD